jgi:5-methylcytosine-specific restriction endonuclease McrA
MSARLEFTPATKRKAMELCGGICRGLIELKMSCDQPAVEVDHIKRCEIEPDNSLENARPLCRAHHLLKSRMDAAAAAKGRRIRRETKKSQKPKAKIRSRGFIGHRKFDGTAVYKERT